MKFRRIVLLSLVILSGFVLNGFAQSVSSVRIRGQVLSSTQNSLSVKDRSGEIVSLTFSDKLQIQEVYPISMNDIQANSFIGTAARTSPSGQLIALEVHVFPESMRGTGEGHRPWDSEPGSTMTNATVQELVSVGSSRELHLKFKDGEKTVFVPSETPIVTYREASKELLVPGANAIVIANLVDGQAQAMRIMVGRDGFKPPM
jgi:hypothetical protein